MTAASGATGWCEGDACVRRRAAGQQAGRVGGPHRLCTACHHRFTAGLGQLPALYRACERVLGGAPAKGLRERTSGGALPGAPFNAAAAEARAAILGVLGSWSGLVAQERGITPPERDPAALAVFLLRHHEWLTAHPAAAEAAREVDRLVVRARRVAHPEPARRVGVGACVEPGCTGRLSALVRAGDGAEHPVVSCDTDPLHTWAGHQWTQLRRRMGRGGPDAGPAAAGRAAVATERWLTAADIARLFGTPVGTVYRLASEQRWRRRQRAGRTFYSEADAHDCFSRRAERARPA